MDETAVWLDCPCNTTFKQGGPGTFKVKMTMHDKSHITVILVARGKWDIANSNLQVIVSMSPKGGINQENTYDFVKACNVLFNKHLLVWDAFRYHTSDDTKSKCRQAKIQMSTILTPNMWVGSVSYMWVATLGSLIEACAITNILDGSEDGDTLCLREGEPSSVSKEDFSDLTQRLIVNDGNYVELALDNRQLLVDIVYGPSGLFCIFTTSKNYIFSSSKNFQHSQ